MTDHIPDYMNYQKSITRSFTSLKDRFRFLVEHWLTDGGWKETLLRSVLKKHLPENFIVGQGFIVSGERASTQIDILIVSSDHPTLFKEDDLMIVTPDAVRAIIEVKTKLVGEVDISEATDKITKNKRLCINMPANSIWTGLFVYDEANSETPKNLLKAVKESKVKNGTELNCSCFGSNFFMRNLKTERIILNEAWWQTYNLENLAPSYFIGNLIGHLSGFTMHHDNSVWFPITEGKSNYATYEIKDSYDEPLNLRNDVD